MAHNAHRKVLSLFALLVLLLLVYYWFTTSKQHALAGGHRSKTQVTCFALLALLRFQLYLLYLDHSLLYFTFLDSGYLLYFTCFTTRAGGHLSKILSLLAILVQKYKY